MTEIKPMPANARNVFKGTIFDVWQWDQELYDGSFSTFERLSRPDYAYVVGVLENGQILLVEDEQPDRNPVLTAAGGKVDPGETPEAAAKRELLEETGYSPAELIKWHSYRPSSKVVYAVHAYIGRGLAKTSEPQLEPGEKISEKLYSFDEFIKLGRDDYLRDWLLKILLLRAELDESKKEELRKLLYG